MKMLNINFNQKRTINKGFQINLFSTINCKGVGRTYFKIESHTLIDIVRHIPQVSPQYLV